MSEKTGDSTFETDVLKSVVPVLVDFWAPWCGPCRIVAPVIDKISEEIDGKAKVYKLNIDENPATAAKYGITGIPTVIVFKNGKCDTQLLGVQQEQVYLHALDV